VKGSTLDLTRIFTARGEPILEGKGGSLIWSKKKNVTVFTLFTDRKPEEHRVGGEEGEGPNEAGERTAFAWAGNVTVRLGRGKK